MHLKVEIASTVIACALAAGEAPAMAQELSAPDDTPRSNMRARRAATDDDADDEPVARKSLLPIDDANRARWYRPEAAEITPPDPREYWPGGVLVEPQVVTGARGGMLTTLRVNLPIGTGAGFSAGVQLAESPRFIGGFDFLRYVGQTVPLTSIEGLGRVSLILAPTFAINGFVNASAGGADISVEPVGVRALLSSVHVMSELRLVGHFLYGGELDSFGGGDNALARPSGALAVGLQLNVVPLLVKVKAPHKQARHDEARSVAPKLLRPSPREDDDVDDDEPPARKKRRQRDEEEEESSTAPRVDGATTFAAYGGAR